MSGLRTHCSEPKFEGRRDADGGHECVGASIIAGVGMSPGLGAT